MRRSVQIALVLGVLAGGVGVLMRVSGAVFFIVLWIVAMAALDRYLSRRK